MVRKIVFAMLAVFALSAIVSASAFAEETLLAEWLVKGAAIPAGTTFNTETKGAIELRDTKTFAGSAAVLCTATADGTVGPNGEDEVTAILNANGEPVAALPGLALLGTDALSGEGSECLDVSVCALGSTTSPIEVWPIGLPWLSLLFLDQVLNKFLELLWSPSGTIGYQLLCLVLGLNTEDTCTAPANDFEFEVANDPENAAILAGTKTNLALCTQSGEETGENTADALTEIKLTNLELLSVSSEP